MLRSIEGEYTEMFTLRSDTAVDFTRYAPGAFDTVVTAPPEESPPAVSPPADAVAGTATSGTTAAAAAATNRRVAANLGCLM
ncbi:hypothetical protein RE943_32870 [Prescottella equi]|nr:hypothetical protein RE943_32870 [Prescottella equi]BDE60273.1 hypothetical protein REA19_32890 [Prescottella equi]